METKDTLKEMAQAYEPKMTIRKNISELDKISVNLKPSLVEGMTAEGKSFEYVAVTIEEIEYKVPYSVITGLKVLVEDNPELTHFKVKKTGEGMNTSYMVLSAIE